MKREVIILSSLDLEIMKFIKEERFVKDIVHSFDMNYSSCNKHLNRLRKLKCFNEDKFGTFSKIKINKDGLKLLEIFNGI
jgi:predicted transcriptional regulator